MKELIIKDWEISCEKVFLNTDYLDIMRGKNDIIKMLKDTYPICKSHISKEFLSRDFTGMSLYKVFVLYNEELRKLSLEITKGDTKYHFSKIKCVTSGSSSTYFMLPIDFLPELKDRDIVLHELVFDFIRLLMKATRISWDSEQFPMDYYQDTVSEADEDADLPKHYNEKFHELAEEYGRSIHSSPEYFDNTLINVLTEKRTQKDYVDMFRNKLDSYQSTKRIFRRLKQWMTDNISILSLDVSFDSYHYSGLDDFAREMYGCSLGECEFNDGMPLGINDIYFVTWYSDQSYESYMDEYLGSVGNQCGVADYYSRSSIKSKSDFKKSLVMDEDDMAVSMVEKCFAEFTEIKEKYKKSFKTWKS